MSISFLGFVLRVRCLEFGLDEIWNERSETGDEDVFILLYF